MTNIKRVTFFLRHSVLYTTSQRMTWTEVWCGVQQSWWADDYQRKCSCWACSLM